MFVFKAKRTIGAFLIDKLDKFVDKLLINFIISSIYMESTG